MKKIRLLLTVLLVFKSISCFCQFDTEFWFAVPYASPLHDPNNQYRLVFSTSAEPSVVTISVPQNPLFAPVTLPISVNSSAIYNFSTAGRASMVFPPATGDVVINKGVKITSTTPVFCYYLKSASIFLK